MIVRAIKINEDRFCEKSPYQEAQGTTNRSTCISCQMKEKDPRLMLSELGVVTHLGAKYLVCFDNGGYISYELPENLRVMIIEK